MTVTARLKDCPFCVRLHKGEYEKTRNNNGIVTFEPLNPVTPGHRLFIPPLHTEWNDPFAARDAALCMESAVRWAYYYYWPSFNIITSCGPSATQTVAHLHVHFVPRREGDGLRLPWSEQ
jgi:histidine triad (HIT) family protein